MYSILFDLWICQLLIKVSMIFITCTSRPQLWETSANAGAGEVASWRTQRLRLTWIQLSHLSRFFVLFIHNRWMFSSSSPHKGVKEHLILELKFTLPYLYLFCFVLSWFSLEVLKIYINKSMWTWPYTTYRAYCCFWFVTFFPCSTVLQFFS